MELPTKSGCEMHDQEFRDYIVKSLAELQQSMKMLTGNGQPGIIKEIQNAHDALTAKVNRMLVAVAILAVAGSISAWPHVAPFLELLVK